MLRFIFGLLIGMMVSSLAYLGLSMHQEGIEWSRLLQVKEPIEQNELADKMLSSPEQNEADAVPTFVTLSKQTLNLGMDQAQVIQLFGEPQRIDPSAYGYEWWIYNDSWETYKQVGMKEGKVVTFYTNAPDQSWGKFSPGMAWAEWNEHFNKKEEVSVSYNKSFFTFRLTAEDRQERPLMINGEEAIQLYIDIHDNQKISGLRVMDIPTLILQRPFSLTYFGSLPELPLLSTEEENELARALEQQVFDLVNVTRQRHQLSLLTWNDAVALVAKGHSIDMQKNQYFDHISERYGDLGQRLEQGNIVYRLAGENIAWNYMDAPDAHEGWLNSLGHRKNVLTEDFNQLGVGVFEQYYTQNFIR